MCRPPTRTRTYPDLSGETGVTEDGYYWIDSRRRRADRRRSKVRRDKGPDGRRVGERRSPRERRIRPGSSGILDAARVKSSAKADTSGPADRRRLPRSPLLVLHPKDRETLHAQRRAALSCGTRFAAFRRFEDAGSHAVEHRMAVRTSCGTRGCPDCMQDRRERIGYRAMFPAAIFATFTVSSAEWSCRDAWIQVGEWVSKLAQRIRQTARKPHQTVLRKTLAAQQLALENWIEGGTHRRGPGPVQYAWVVEPHASGWPHVHVLFGLDWIDYNWLRAEWKKIVRTERANVHCERVFEVEGACRYLTEYISKSILTLDILAVMHRRRIFGTTIPKVIDRIATWSREEETHADDAFRQASRPEDWGVNDGWKVDPSSYSGCALWSRTVSWQEIAQRLPTRRIVDDGPFVYDAVATLPPALRRLFDSAAFVGRTLDVTRSPQGSDDSREILSTKT